MCVTHTHGDHFGGIGTLPVLSYVNKIPLNIVLDKNSRHISQVEAEVTNKGCQKDVSYVDFKDLANKFKAIKSAKYIPTTHSNDGVESHGIQFETPNGIIYYSGDTNAIEQIKDYVKSKSTIRVYSDLCDEQSASHITVEQMEKHIPSKHRKKILAMHINEGFDEKRVEKLGIKTVKAPKYRE